MSDDEAVLEAEEEGARSLRVRLRLVEAIVFLSVLLNLVQGVVIHRNEKRMQGQIDDVRQEAAAGLDLP
jgi:hypothetical protein